MAHPMPHLRAERIDAAVERLSQRAFAFLDVLVRERSLPGDETGAERVLAAELERIGLAVERVPYPVGSSAILPPGRAQRCTRIEASSSAGSARAARAPSS